MEMKPEMIYAILGIEETKDKELIQNAYRTKLVDCNPEDHPEAFMRLRQAYELALAYADRVEDDEEEREDNSPVGVWISKVKAVYHSIKKRIDVDIWKQLMADEVCDDLELCEEARIRLFEFLMESYRLPVGIYQLLNERYEIEDHPDEFKEFLPVNFVDFMIRMAHKEEAEDFSYTWLAGPDGADFDFFIQSLSEIEVVMEEDLMKAQDLIEAMKATDITHPFLLAYESVLLAKSGFEEEALDLAREVIAEYAQCAYAVVIASEAMYLAGEKEEAVSHFRYAAEHGGGSYLSEKYLAIDEMERENFPEAVRHCKEAMHHKEDEPIRALFQEIDRRYLLHMKDQIETGSVSAQELGDVLKALLRNEREQEALCYINAYPDALEKVPYGQSYRIDILCCTGNTEEAITEGNDYAEELLLCQCEEDEWKQAYLRTCYYTGKAYQTKAFQLKEEKSAKFWKQLKEMAEKTEDGLVPHHMVEGKPSVQPEDGWEFMCSVADKDAYLARREAYCSLFDSANAYFMKMLDIEPDEVTTKMEIIISNLGAQNYAEMVTFCENCLEEQPGNFFAMTYLQKAYYEQGRTTEVLELYRDCCAVYPGYHGVYELAARLFIDYSQYEDAKQVIEAARQNGADHIVFEVLECKMEANRCRANSQYDEKQDVVSRLLVLAKKILDEDDNNNSEIIAEIFSVLASYTEFVQNLRDRYADIPEEEGLDLFYANCCVAATVNPGRRFYMLGYYYKRYKDYTKAARCFRLSLMFDEENLAAAFQLGTCLVDSGNQDEGLQYYEKVLADNMDYWDVASRAAFYYKVLYDKVDICNYLFRAEELAKYAVEHGDGDPFDIMTYGKCLLDDGKYESAIEQMKILFQFEHFRIEAHRICGHCLRALGRFEEAVEVLREGIALLEPGEDDYSLYGELTRTYQRGYGLEEVEAAYYEAKARGENYYMMAADYARALEKAGRYEEAFAFFKNDLELEDNYAFSDKYNIERMLDMEKLINVRDNGDRKQLETHLLSAYEESISKYNNVAMQRMAGEKLSYFYAYEEGNFEKAAEYMHQHLTSVFENNVRTCVNHYWTGKTELCECQNKYVSAVNNLMYIARLYHLNGDAKAVAAYLDEFRMAVSIRIGVCEDEDEMMERFASTPTWGLSNTTMILEYYILRDDKERAKKWFDAMVCCRMCGECYHKGTDCTDQYEYMGLYYEYIGDMENAKKYYSIAFRANPTIDIAYYKLNRLKENDDARNKGDQSVSGSTGVVEVSDPMDC